ncbi:hypothetical protein [Brevibacterium sp. CT2-23B]|uniref:hypothetical protein n=1 Tax=Brevibacterium sp. CT2-23B TaxID=2729630 RepID=UPI001552B9BF|nr:hypothetical protein [Brevibacterium sp. CT2-23B]
MHLSTRPIRRGERVSLEVTGPVDDELAVVDVDCEPDRCGWGGARDDVDGVAAVVLRTHNRHEVPVVIVEVDGAALDAGALRLRVVRHRRELPVQTRNISSEPVKTRIQAHVIFSDLRICNVEVFFSG